jgi:hypothetical protein
MFLARDIDDAAPARPDEDEAMGEEHDESADQEVFGFLTPHAPDGEFTFADRVEDYPETWLEYDAKGNPRLKPHYRAARPRSFTVASTGAIDAGTRVWFLPGKFRFCLRCGATQGGAARDRNRLASLSAEGRSSATTVLVSSALRWMHGLDSGLDEYTRKILGFTDNRQDAALQSGHFNDFLFVSLVRAGFLGALDAAGPSGLRSDALGIAQQKALGFDRAAPEVRAEWLLAPTLRGFNLQEAEGTLRQVLAYRAWFDQRRGWRYTNPNLEQLELVNVNYLGLNDLAGDDALFTSAPSVFRDASPPGSSGRLQEDSRPSASMDGDPQPGARPDGDRTDPGEIAQPHSRTLGLRRGREAAPCQVADDRPAIPPRHDTSRRGPHCSRGVPKCARQDASCIPAVGWE